MDKDGNKLDPTPVALLTEGVGRNLLGGLCFVLIGLVALLTEGVGRNGGDALKTGALGQVALLTEGVGRNAETRSAAFRTAGSPSSRRAWVEISAARN